VSRVVCRSPHDHGDDSFPLSVLISLVRSVFDGTVGTVDNDCDDGGNRRPNTRFRKMGVGGGIRKRVLLMPSTLPWSKVLVGHASCLTEPHLCVIQ
jgi:hypothetical protein